MMRLIIRIVVVYVALLLQTTIAVKLEISGIIPNLVLVSLLVFQFFSRPDEMIHIAFWSGIALDSFSVNYFGINGFSFLISSYVVYYINLRLFVDDILSKILLNVFGVFLYYLIYLLVVNINRIYLFPHDFFHIGFPSFLYTSLLSSLILFLSFIRK